jgi:ribosomal protein S4E
MSAESQSKLKNGDLCLVVGGTHKGKSGVIQDMNVTKTGAITITVVQNNGIRFKTLLKNVGVKSS